MLVDKFNKNFEKCYSSSEILCIDELPINSDKSQWSRRHTFKQCVKYKKYRYDIKLCKLCFIATTLWFCANDKIFYSKKGRVIAVSIFKK